MAWLKRPSRSSGPIRLASLRKVVSANGRRQLEAELGQDGNHGGVVCAAQCATGTTDGRENAVCPLGPHEAGLLGEDAARVGDFRVLFAKRLGEAAGAESSGNRVAVDQEALEDEEARAVPRAADDAQAARW